MPSPSCSIDFISVTFTRRASRLAECAISVKTFEAFFRFSVSSWKSSLKRSSLGMNHRMTASTFTHPSRD
jgi:hypothetical protein